MRLHASTRPHARTHPHGADTRPPRIATRSTAAFGCRPSKRATLTVLLNGVLIQNNAEIKGTTVHVGLPEYFYHTKAPLVLEDNGQWQIDPAPPASFRNIWVRELD